MRNLYWKLEGGTKGPIGPKGPIGIAVKNLNENLKPFIQFAQIHTDVPILDRKIFNGKQDLIMLYDLCIGISTGIIGKRNF